MTEPFGFVSLSLALPYWPGDLVGEPAYLDEVGVRDFEIDETTGLDVTGTLLWLRELAFDLSLVDGLALAFLSSNGGTAVPFELDIEPEPELRLPSLPIALRFKGDLLRPVKLQDGIWVPDMDAAGRRKQAEIRFGGVGLSIDGEGEVELIMPAGAPVIGLAPVEIGQTGLVLEVNGLRPFLSASQTPPAGAPAGFRGIALDSVRLHLPKDVNVPLAPSELSLERMLIGTGGVSGIARGTWTPTYKPATKGFAGNGSGELFEIPFGLRSLHFEFAQNVPVAAGLKGDVLLPFFEQPVRVDLSLKTRGGFAIGLSSTQPAGATHANGLVTFDKPGIVRCSIDSLGLEYDRGIAKAKLSGHITPLIAGIDWPTFEVRELSIDSKGNVKLDGGWLDLREARTLDFHGFKIEITKIGFGQMDDGAKWIGFSGGIKLVEGIPAGASVEGLRVVWYEDGRRPPHVTLNGVEVQLSVPGAFSFKGNVSFRELTVGNETIRRFDGDIALKLHALDIDVDAVLVVGSATPGGAPQVSVGTKTAKPPAMGAIAPTPGAAPSVAVTPTPATQGRYTFFAIYLAVAIPDGIPLWATGLGLYGVEGLVALNMGPDKKPAEEWYEGWYKRPETGIVDLRSKWVPKRGALALGAGVTLGTHADNGFTFNGRFALMVVLPGPIVMIEGRANLLKQRAKLSEEANFRALAVLDGQAGSVLVGLDARYKFNSAGALVDIRGGAEAYYSFHDPTAWHLYLGQRDPRDKRIRAKLFQLFEANAYFMLSGRELALGAWIGYDRRWKFGPLSLTLEAWLEANARVSWRPAHFYGDAWVHGKIALKVFRFGLGLTLDARLAVDVFDPLHIVGQFSVRIDLPWPLPDFGVNVKIEWGPRKDPPPLPAPLQEITIEHPKATATWPLTRGALLAPSHADADGMLRAPSPTVAAQASLGPPAGAPVVPLDARPHVTFGRAMHDIARVGVNAQPPVPARERIGDPARNQGPATARFELTEVTLDLWTGSAWQRVARKAADANPGGVSELFGSWAPVPNLPTQGTVAPAQTKLALWSKSPFDYLTHTGGEWADWVAGALPRYPCVPPAPPRHLCWQVDPAHGGPDGGSLLDPATGELLIALPEPSGHVTITAAGGPTAAPTPRKTCVVFGGRPAAQVANPVRERDAEILVLNADGFPLSTASIADDQERYGLDCNAFVDIKLPCKSSKVTLTFSYIPRQVDVDVLDAQGNVVATQRGTTIEGPAVVDVLGVAIERVRIRTSFFTGISFTFLASICWTCAGRGPGGAQVTGSQSSGLQLGPYGIVPGVGVELTGADITQLVVSGNVPSLGILTVCIDLPPDPATIAYHQELSQHVQNQTVRWSQETPVLEPDTSYRLGVATRVDARDFAHNAGWNGPRDQQEFAYFRTEGPPGLATLSAPAGQPPSAPYDTGLDDLTRYVRQTVPPTVPAAGAAPRLPRPVYRAYDVGVEFNEDYVETMYARSRRDLGLYLFDNNQRPVRDARGRIVAPANRWGRIDALTLTQLESQWIQTVNNGTCAHIDVASIPHDDALAVGQPGLVLDGDTVYEARLVPLLLHERFTTAAIGDAASGPSGSLHGWSVRDDGTTGGPSLWRIGADNVAGAPRHVRQLSSIRGAATAAGQPGTMLLRGDAQWTDFRLTATLRTGAAAAIGVVFRYQDPSRYYRFAVDPDLGYRRLVKVTPAGQTVLAEDDGVIHTDTDYTVTVEAVGGRLAVLIDGEPLFAVTDADVPSGRIGLYAHGNGAAFFSDIRLDDLRPGARSTYAFAFTTSRFATFAHHLHSYDDVTRAVALQPGSGAAIALPGQVAAAVAPGGVPGDAEARTYEQLATAVLGQAARNDPPAIEATRVESDGVAYGLLLRGPEPIDPLRTSFGLQRATRPVPATRAPGRVKLTGATFAAQAPNDEAVTLMLRDLTELSGARIEQQGFGDPIAEPVGDPVLFERTFATQPGTDQVLGGDPDGADYRLTARMHVRTDARLGVLFRHVDADNHYRLTIERSQNRRRLIRRAAGVETVLWEQAAGIARHTPFTLVVDVVGARLRGYLDGTPLFDLLDGARARGRAGVMRASADSARFERLEIAEPTLESRALWVDDFRGGSLAGWSIFDEGEAGGPSAWAIVAGALCQTSSIRTGSGDPAQPGTLAVAGDPGWSDVIVRARLSSHAAGAVGVAFRVGDPSNLYRFSMDRTGAYRRLIKHVAGVATTLWEDSHAYEAGRTYELVIAAIGDRLRGWIDGVPVFSVSDATLGGGRIGLYAHDAPGARFAQVQVLPAMVAPAVWLVDDQFADHALPGWTILDETDASGPSAWRVEDGELLQESSIVAGGGGDGGPDTVLAGAIEDPRLEDPRAGPDSRGTLAVTGEREWRDYRLSALLRPFTAGAIGVVFRYRNVEEHYRYINDTAAGERRLVRVEGRAATVVWSDDAPLPVGTTGLLAIECVGELITGYVNGIEAFRVADPGGPPSGRVGLLCSGDKGARFGEVRVAPARWSTWHRFGEEDPLPAGTAVSVQAGAATAAGPAPALVERRFKAAAWERGTPALRPDGTELRVVSRDGEVGHACPLLPERAFEAVGLRVLRKLDGAGLFVVPAGEAMIPALYRLTLTFRRDNRAADPGSPVLRQAGVTASEQVAIDISGHVR